MGKIHFEILDVSAQDIRAMRKFIKQHFRNFWIKEQTTFISHYRQAYGEFGFVERFHDGAGSTVKFYAHPHFSQLATLFKLAFA